MYVQFYTFLTFIVSFAVAYKIDMYGNVNMFVNNVRIVYLYVLFFHIPKKFLLWFTSLICMIR